MKKVAYFFCADLNKDPVAPRIFKALEDNFDLSETSIFVDDYPVVEYQASNANIFHFVRIKNILSYNFNKYNAYFKTIFY